ncbi:voltage-gated potassium channel subunit beta-3-like protein [Cricetulus griseus]|nr:voltage-gated potassium channel subunit beta-3-like protein [Cricetulus griseus]
MTQLLPPSAPRPLSLDLPRVRNLGKSGLRVSCLGLGTWVTFGSQISDETAEDVLTVAYEHGVNLFDTAEVYATGKNCESHDLCHQSGPGPILGDIQMECCRDHACGLITSKYDGRVQDTCKATVKGYQWLKEKVQSEDGKKQQARVMDLLPIAHQLDCTVAQLAIAWCLRSEGVSSVLLGVSSAEQLLEHLGSLEVSWRFRNRILFSPLMQESKTYCNPEWTEMTTKLPLQRKVQRDRAKQLRIFLIGYHCGPSSVSQQKLSSPLSILKVLSQLTPQTVMEIDALLGNKSHSKK